MGQRALNGDTGVAMSPAAISETLVLYHNGHEAHWTVLPPDPPRIHVSVCAS